MMTKVFLRTPYNYDTMEASNASGLSCLEPTLPQQHAKDETDINTIVRRFGLTGELPNNVRVPRYGDFTMVSDYQTAMNMVMEANAAFMELPAEVRSRFNNDPGALVDFISETEPAAQYASRYQTMTKDMQSAGLNPMLAYSQSAGASPTAQQVQFQNPMNSALDAYHKSNERDVMSAQVQNILADTKVKDETAKQIVAQTEKARADERLATATANEATVRMASQINYGNPTQKALAASYWSQVDVNKGNLPKIASEIAANGAYAAQARAQAEKAIAEKKITEQDLFRAINDARYERATGGVIRQTSRDLGNITGAAVNARRAGMTKR